MSKDDVNFLLTNCIARNALTSFMGWFSKIEFAPVRYVSIALWRWFCDVDLSDTQETSFASLHQAFIRSLKPGARTIAADPSLITSPCDAIVGAFGQVENGMALQIKNMPYRLVDLLGSAPQAASFEGGHFVTLRLTAGMYHRFHAPHDVVTEQMRYISGDHWNVNPPTLARIDRLFCKNERAPILARLAQTGHRIVMVPVAAVLVASIRLPWLDRGVSVRTGGSRTIALDQRFSKGDEMGWFEHGSTLVMVTPPDCPPIPSLKTGETIKLGDPLFKIVDHASI